MNAYSSIYTRAGGVDFDIPFKVLTIGQETLSVDLPPAPVNTGTSRLVATLSSAGFPQPFAVWEFEISPSRTAGRLMVFPKHYGQRFLLLDHWNSVPVGHVHQMALPPAGTRALNLTLYRYGTTGVSSARYWLQWAGDSERNRRLSAWGSQTVPPVDWFYVELTTHCNLACPFCPSKDLKRPREFMSIENAETLFSKISAYLRLRDATWGYTETRRMVFLHVMGEPLLHPKFVECVTLAVKSGLAPALFTNATLLTEENIAKIFAADLAHVTVSLNVVDQSGFSSLGAKGHIDAQHRRVAQFLSERARRGVHRLHVDIQYIVSDGRTISGNGLVQSRQQVWDCYRKWMLLTQSIDDEKSHPVDPQPVIPLERLANPLATEGSDSSLRLPLAVGIDLVMKSGCSFGNAVIPPGMRLVTTRRGKCPFDNPQRQMAVFVDGSVSFCNLDYENSVKLGSLLDQSVEEIWGSPRMQKIRSAMAAGHVTERLCQRCLGHLVPSLTP